MNLQPFRDCAVSQLRQLLDDGQFAVPRLQRVFVWNGLKSAKLLDSIYRGMPIGALTIWETSKKNRDLLRRDNKVLPPYRDHNASVWFVLDGQQRLSVLYRIQQGGTVENGRHREVDFDRVVFRVTDGDADHARFAYRQPIAGEWIPLPDVLARNWRARLGALKAVPLKRAAQCRARLLTYRVPIVRVETDDIDDARELFIRINSAGTPIAAADRAFARAAEFDLRDHAERAWAGLTPEFQRLTYETLLQTRALLDGMHDVAGDAMERVAAYWDSQIREDDSAKTRFTKQWAAQQQATHRAIDLLKSKFFVLNDGLLPSQYMVATLTVFFVYRPKQPTPDQLAEIRRWFWTTALGQRYSGSGYRQNIVEDAAFFEQLATGKRVRFQIRELIDPEELRRSTYGRRSSIADAFYCLLIAQKPQYLSNGTDMQLADFASMANRRHKHHIFPRQHLLREKRLSKRAVNTILNLCLIPAEENSQIGSKPPRKYLAQYQAHRHFNRVMRRHLIPHHQEAGLWHPHSSDGYQQFLREREALVCAEFERLAGAKLFRSARAARAR